jgi:hypothetical protein
MPTSVWPLPAATAIATRLIALLPTQSGKSGYNLPASANAAKAVPALRPQVVCTHSAESPTWTRDQCRNETSLLVRSSGRVCGLRTILVARPPRSEDLHPMRSVAPDRYRLRPSFAHPRQEP